VFLESSEVFKVIQFAVEFVKLSVDCISRIQDHLRAGVAANKLSGQRFLNKEPNTILSFSFFQRPNGEGWINLIGEQQLHQPNR
jgi:hypothetical protein